MSCKGERIILIFWQRKMKRRLSNIAILAAEISNRLATLKEQTQSNLIKVVSIPN